jgi:hypothetical protein
MRRRTEIITVSENWKLFDWRRCPLFRRLGFSLLHSWFLLLSSHQNRWFLTWAVFFSIKDSIFIINFHCILCSICSMWISIFCFDTKLYLTILGILQLWVQNVKCNQPILHFTDVSFTSDSYIVLYFVFLAKIKEKLICSTTFFYRTWLLQLQRKL